jgi:hypothetical protein
MNHHAPPSITFHATQVMAMDEKQIHLDNAAQQLFAKIEGIEEQKREDRLRK